jgi:PhnB protein
MIVAYLTFNGNTEEAFNFYKSVFDGELNLQRLATLPMVSKCQMKTRKKSCMQI